MQIEHNPSWQANSYLANQILSILWNTKIDINVVGSEVLTETVMKSSIFWDITPSSPLKVNGMYDVIYHKMKLFRWKGYAALESGIDVITAPAMSLMAIPQ
jgi:hypothetical protein